MTWGEDRSETRTTEPARSARRAALVHLLFNLAGAGIWLGVFWLVKLLAAPAILDRAVTLPGVAVIHTAFNLLCTAALFPAAGLLERAVLRLLDKPPRTGGSKYHAFLEVLDFIGGMTDNYALALARETSGF